MEVYRDNDVAVGQTLLRNPPADVRLFSQGVHGNHLQMVFCECSGLLEVQGPVVEEPPRQPPLFVEDRCKIGRIGDDVDGDLFFIPVESLWTILIKHVFRLEQLAIVILHAVAFMLLTRSEIHIG